MKDADGAVAEFGIAAAQLVEARAPRRRAQGHRAPAPPQARPRARAHRRRALPRAQPAERRHAGAREAADLLPGQPEATSTRSRSSRARSTAIGQAAKAIEVQKEMARIAREQGKTELFQELVDKLQQARAERRRREAARRGGDGDAAAAAAACAAAARTPTPRARSAVADRRPRRTSRSRPKTSRKRAFDAEPIPLRSDRPGPMPREPARHDAAASRRSDRARRASSAPELTVVERRPTIVVEDSSSGERAAS